MIFRKLATPVEFREANSRRLDSTGVANYNLKSMSVYDQIVFSSGICIFIRVGISSILYVLYQLYRYWYGITKINAFPSAEMYLYSSDS